MKYVKIVDGIVDVVRFTPKDGYTEAPETVFGGFSYANGQFATPTKEQSLPVIPSTVSARQFKLQLEIQGLTLAVETWVSAQSKLVRIAYANSGRFDRNEPMLQAGFKALGFTGAALDAFYVEAAKL